MTIREQIMEECENFVTNFHGVDDLNSKENDYNEAKNGGYEFDECPQSYKCLVNAEELCKSEKFNDMHEKCIQCWKKALGE
jgi:hypothetical protein